MRNSRCGDVRDRFFSRFVIDSNNCWVWNGAKITHKRTGDSYGCIAGKIDGVRYVKQGRQILAHRASWILHYGAIPVGEGYHGTVVRHKCDNPLCVNPEHLELGTQKDNVDDMLKRNRGDISGFVNKRGTEHRNAKLNAEQVAEIVNSSEMNYVLAEKYGVSTHCIKRVRCGKTYFNITDHEALKESAKKRKGLSRPGLKSGTAKLTADQVRYIRSSPLNTYQLADELGVTQPTVASARRRATYKDVD
jgi:hypothetical protein